MNESKLFWMPDYFPSFSCKMGACRTACCTGWQVSISLENYFALIGTDCSMDLRRKMDCALKPVDYPDEGKYAVIQPNYFGDCPLRLEDGRCGLQVELGEDILPDICRLYPRGVRRTERGYEICRAASCEAVPEMLLHKDEPISFIEREWAMKLPPMPAEALGDPAVRMEKIKAVQDRTRPLALRLGSLGGIVPEQTSERTLTALWELLLSLGEHSDSLAPFVERAAANLAQRPLSDAYAEARSAFESAFPMWETFFEHLLVNHMFFTRYPYSESGMQEHHRFASLVTVYAAVRMLSALCTANDHSEEVLTDAVAAAFRLIDHTDFDRTALHLLGKHGLAGDLAELPAV